MKKLPIVLVLAVLLMLAMPVAASAAGITVTGRTGDGEWTNNTWQVEIYPGESESTTLNLYNSSSSSLGVEVTISPSSLDNGNLTFELDKATFTMPGRSYTDVTLSVKASGSATPGIYAAELKIKSEVAPAPPEPTEPEVVEPEVIEPEEPEEPEPVEPEPEEPEEPEPVAPELEEPIEPEPVEPEEEEKPEVVEPEEEEPEVVEPEEPTEPEEPGEEEVIVVPRTPWGLIGGVVGGLVAAGGIGYWLWRRRRKEANYGS